MDKMIQLKHSGLKQANELPGLQETLFKSKGTQTTRDRMEEGVPWKYTQKERWHVILEEDDKTLK